MGKNDNSSIFKLYSRAGTKILPNDRVEVSEDSKIQQDIDAVTNAFVQLEDTLTSVMLDKVQHTKVIRDLNRTYQATFRGLIKSKKGRTS